MHVALSVPDVADSFDLVDYLFVLVAHGHPDTVKITAVDVTGSLSNQDGFTD